jgi:hypothetical protein
MYGSAKSGFMTCKICKCLCTILVPPSTVDFLVILRNQFREKIVEKLSLDTQYAIKNNSDPREMTFEKSKTISKEILEAVYGKNYNLKINFYS